MGTAARAAELRARAAAERQEARDSFGRISRSVRIRSLASAGAGPVGRWSEVRWSEPIKVGDRVRERAWRVPPGCQPFEGRAVFVAPDGWVGVNLGSRTFSFAPHEVEKAEEVAA